MKKTIFFALIAIIAFTVSSCGVRSTGEVTGTITKVETDGNWFPSQEITLHYASKDVISGDTVWQFGKHGFTIDGDSVVKCITPKEDILKYEETGCPVVVKYVKLGFLENLFYKRGKTNSFITSITPVMDIYDTQIEQAKKDIRDKIIKEAIESIPKDMLPKENLVPKDSTILKK